MDSGRFNEIQDPFGIWVLGQRERQTAQAQKRPLLFLPSVVLLCPCFHWAAGSTVGCWYVPSSEPTLPLSLHGGTTVQHLVPQYEQRYRA